MKNKTTIIICLMLSACAQMQGTPTRTANVIEDNTSATWNEARELLGVKKKVAVKPEKTEQRYCYKSYEDITCYEVPLAGEDSRLVAYQGSSGQTGYLIHTNIASSANNNAPLKPLDQVNVATPPKVLAAKDPNKDKKLKEIIFDPAELQPKDLVTKKTDSQ